MLSANSLNDFLVLGGKTNLSPLRRLADFAKPTRGIFKRRLFKTSEIQLIWGLPPSIKIKSGSVHSLCFRRLKTISSKARKSSDGKAVFILNKRYWLFSGSLPEKTAIEP